MARRVCQPTQERGSDWLDRREPSRARMLVLGLGLGPWSLTRRLADEGKYVAYLVRYSHGALGWDEARDLPITEIHRRVRDLNHWIKIENTPSKSK